MKRFFMSLGNFFKLRYVPTSSINDVSEIEEPVVSDRVVLDSRTDKFDYDDEDNFEEIENFKPDTLTNKQRILSVIELHNANFENKPFTTAMVYNWLRGEMPILTVRKCIYKLHSQGILEGCKKTFSNNKRVKFYSLKNAKSN